MVSVRNDELFITHLAPNKLDHTGMGNLPHLVQNPIFVAGFHVRLAAGRQNAIDFSRRIAVKHKELPKVSSRGAQ